MRKATLRPWRYCQDCGEDAKGHTGTYCQSCGEPVAPEPADPWELTPAHVEFRREVENAAMDVPAVRLGRWEPRAVFLYGSFLDVHHIRVSVMRHLGVEVRMDELRPAGSGVYKVAVL